MKIESGKTVVNQKFVLETGVNNRFGAVRIIYSEQQIDKLLVQQKRNQMKESIVAKKSVEFAILVIQTYKMLCEEKREFVMSKQFLKSGTSIGAQIKEAEHAQSRADFFA